MPKAAQKWALKKVGNLCNPSGVEGVRKKINAKNTFLTNATHDIDHKKINLQLKKEKIDVKYAYDGQKIKIKL